MKIKEVTPQGVGATEELWGWCPLQSESFSARRWSDFTGYDCVFRIFSSSTSLVYGIVQIIWRANTLWPTGPRCHIFKYACPIWICSGAMISLLSVLGDLTLLWWNSLALSQACRGSNHQSHSRGLCFGTTNTRLSEKIQRTENPWNSSYVISCCPWQKLSYANSSLICDHASYTTCPKGECKMMLFSSRPVQFCLIYRLLYY